MFYMFPYFGTPDFNGRLKGLHLTAINWARCVKAGKHLHAGPSALKWGLAHTNKEKKKLNNYDSTDLFK